MTGELPATVVGATCVGCDSPAPLTMETYGAMTVAMCATCGWTHFAYFDGTRVRVINPGLGIPS